jgi:hypothetical protein
MNYYPRKLTHLILLVLLATWSLLFGSPQPMTAQTTTTLSRAEVDRMLYVSNAFDIIDRSNTPELVALPSLSTPPSSATPNTPRNA